MNKDNEINKLKESNRKNEDFLKELLKEKIQRKKQIILLRQEISQLKEHLSNAVYELNLRPYRT